MIPAARLPAWLGFAAVAALSWAAFHSAHVGVERWMEHRGRRGTNALEWIERSFQPDSAALEAMRKVHEAYAKQLGDLASQLNHERRTLAAMVLQRDRWSPEVAAQIARVDEAVARSQVMTWQYLYEISDHLSPAKARVFRREMATATLGASAP